MTGAYIDKEYVYAVARIRGAETKLLTKQGMDQLIGAQGADDAVRMLEERGFGAAEGSKTAEDLLSAEREKLWALIDELVPEKSIFDVFRLPNDYSNLKAAIKESVMEYAYPGIYIDEATVSPELIRQAVKERRYQDLPQEMAEVAQEAHDAFLRTKDGQLCDIIVDRACLLAVREAGRKSGNEFLDMYAELSVAAADIKIAVRAAFTGKDAAFLNRALCPCDTLDVSRLTQAAANGQDAIASYLMTTDYQDAVPDLKKSPAAFERWCDNLIIRRMQPQLYNSFGLGPIAAYILAKENEIKSVRIILTGKQNGFGGDMIRERVRETYV